MSSGYHRPSSIPDDRGGDSSRVSAVVQLLSQVPLEGATTALDVGMGAGVVARYLAGRGMKVVGTGLEVASYGIDPPALRDQHGIEVVECPIDDMPFDDRSFEIVVLSHVLEHCPNMGLALQEVRRVLSDDGRLIVFVPPFSDYVCAGHINTGWTIGQLMYVLLLNGFDVSGGSFVEYGGSVCGVVGRAKASLPALRGDRGDIRLLADAGLFPLPIVHDQPPPNFDAATDPRALVSVDSFDDGYFGHLRAIHWPSTRASEMTSRKHRLAVAVVGLLPSRLRTRIKRLL